MPNRLNRISAICTRLIIERGDLIQNYKGVVTSLIGSNGGKEKGRWGGGYLHSEPKLSETMTLTIHVCTCIANVHTHSNPQDPELELCNVGHKYLHYGKSHQHTCTVHTYIHTHTHIQWDIQKHLTRVYLASLNRTSGYY